jgi:hypothetical protein
MHARVRVCARDAYAERREGAEQLDCQEEMVDAKGLEPLREPSKLFSADSIVPRVARFDIDGAQQFEAPLSNLAS